MSENSEQLQSIFNPEFHPSSEEKDLSDETEISPKALLQVHHDLTTSKESGVRQIPIFTAEGNLWKVLTIPSKNNETNDIAQHNASKEQPSHSTITDQYYHKMEGLEVTNEQNSSQMNQPLIEKKSFPAQISTTSEDYSDRPYMYRQINASTRRKKSLKSVSSTFVP